MSIINNKFTSELTLDVYSADLQVITAQQGDVRSRFVKINILANGEPMTFVSGLSAVLKGHRADGQVIYDKCTIEGNSIIIELTDAILAVDGDCVFNIGFYSTDNSLLSTIPFKVHVMKDPYDENEIIATPIFSALTEALNKVNKAIQDAEKVVKDATEKINEMNQLKDDLSDMMDEFEQAEKDRENAESTRNQNVNDAIDKINDAIDNANEKVDELVDDANEKINDAIDNANEATDRANQAADNFDNLMNDKFEDVFVEKSEVGVANGVASLDKDGKVPLEQLPEIDTGICVHAQEDEPAEIEIDEHWFKIIGTYNNGTIGNIFLAYVLNHILRNHDGTTTLGETENVICKNGQTITPVTKNFEGYLAETPSKVTITERGQVVDVYYDEQQYNILYVLSSGTNHSSNPSKIYYTEEFTLKNATKTYATFSGWYTDSAFANKITKLSKISKDTTVYAKWIETEYGITYILDGGTNASSNPNVITYYQTVNLADATKSGHTFNGWYTDAGFTNKVTTLSNINSDITLYAKFTEISSGGDSGNTGSGDNEDTSGRIYLYNYGDECVGVTGGWTGRADSAGSLIKESTYMELKTGGEQSGDTACSVNVETVFNVLGTYANVYVKYSLSGNPEAKLLRKVSNGSYAGGDKCFSESTDIAIFNDIFPTGMAYSGALSILSRLTYTEVDESKIIPVYTFPETSLKIYQVWLDTREGSSSDNEGTDSGNSGSSSGDSSDSSEENTTETIILYDNGDQCTDVTGGWTVDNDFSYGALTLSKLGSYLHLSKSSNYSDVNTGSLDVRTILYPLKQKPYNIYMTYSLSLESPESNESIINIGASVSIVADNGSGSGQFFNSDYDDDDERKLIADGSTYTVSCTINDGTALGNYGTICPSIMFAVNNLALTDFGYKVPLITFKIYKIWVETKTT